MDIKPIKQRGVVPGGGDGSSAVKPKPTDSSVSAADVQPSADRVSISPQAQKVSAASLPDSISASDVPGLRTVSGASQTETKDTVRRSAAGFFEESQARVDTRKNDVQEVAVEDSKIVRASAATRVATEQIAQDSKVTQTDVLSEDRVRVISEHREMEALQSREKSVRSLEYAYARTTGRLLQSQVQFQSAPIFGSQDGGVVNPDVGNAVQLAGQTHATIRKMDDIRQAALASENPTPRDRSVALRASMVQIRARQQLVENRRQEQGNVIGIGADASSPVTEALREQIGTKAVDKSNESDAIERSEEPGSVVSSEGAVGETSLNPLVDSARSYQKNVEASQENQESKQLKDVLV